MSTFLSRLIRFIRRRWLLLALLLIVLGGIGWYVRSRSQAQKQEVTYVSPQYRDLTQTLEVSGVVDADEKANMRFALGGKVVYLGAKEGDMVKKGAVIASIDQAQLRKQLQQDLNNYQKERLTFDQSIEDLNNAPPLSQQELQQKLDQLDLNNTVLNVEIRDIAIRDSRLLAPFGGMLVASPLTTPGVNISASEAFELINPNTLIFKAAVDEADVPVVKTGQPVSISLDAYPDDPITGATIEYIAYKSQQTSTSTVYIIKIPLRGNDLLTKYRLGMSGDATITIDTRANALSIPLDATRQRNDKTYVDVKEGSNPKVEREITTGLETDDYVEVLSGLTPEDQVVLPEGVTVK